MSTKSGSTEEIADKVDALYQSIIVAGTHKAESIKVAEAAKVIENTQRDLNIALINELSILFSMLEINIFDGNCTFKEIFHTKAKGLINRGVGTNYLSV